MEPSQTWPDADVIIGNPPFLGGKRLITHLGEDYVSQMFKTYADRVPAEADLVCYWFEKTGQQIESGMTNRAGLVATNSIRGGANRRCTPGRDGQSANLRSVERRAVGRRRSGRTGVTGLLLAHRRRIRGWHFGSMARTVDEVYADLTARRGGAGVDLTIARRLAENAAIAFMGDTKGGSFDIAGDQAREWLRLPANPNGRTNADVLKPWVNAMALTRRPAGKWIVDFGLDNVRTPMRRCTRSRSAGCRNTSTRCASSNRREAYRRATGGGTMEPRQGMWAALAGRSR